MAVFDFHRMYTNPLNYTGSICVQFAYCMNGIHIGSLQLFTMAGNGGHRITVWLMEGEQGTDWFHAKVNLKDVKHDTRVRQFFILSFKKMFCFGFFQ
jgi:hypothetical protein